MILHFSHIGLTEGRTVMIPFGVVPDGVALVTVRPPLPSRGAQTVAHRGLAGPSATKQNTKPPRPVIRRYSAALGIWVLALYGAVPMASAARRSSSTSLRDLSRDLDRRRPSRSLRAPRGCWVQYWRHSLAAQPGKH